ncbi:superoxide dismutase [Ferruginibacter albus]|uniref:superoxide dismutase n=1 Tax=Ferruginibacter albus TaxID=2875540 RepID=UPI001CC7753D|nr:superoxide dismutase [Ferruginibacter albus]UAY51629.1 superoxide dismutase [Ferruginibacter albus]
MKPSSRRKFLSDSTKIGLGSLLISPTIVSALNNTSFSKKDIYFLPTTGFKQEPLSYAYNALEPYIDALTMDIHYNKHASAYCKNLNDATIAEKVDVTKPVEDLLATISKYSAKMLNNAGGHYNHELFWKLLSPKGETKPTGTLLAAIEKDFSSFDSFKTKFADAAKARFGSGWAWLIINSDKTLVITSTPNQNNTLMDNAEVKGFPLLGLDVWEHAYYLHYQNKRADYIDSFWKILNWDYVQQRFDSIK